jgi:hypothetical protein
MLRVGFASVLPLVLCIALAAAPNSPALAAESAAPSYPELFVDDVQHVLSAPARWDKDDWHTLGWASLAVVGTAVVLDDHVRTVMRDHNDGSNQFMLQVERFGSEYAWGVLGGFYLAGSLGNDDKAVAVAQDGLTASFIASGLVTPALKYAAGRSRPNDNGGTDDTFTFKPFSGAASFPSGHTTEAFALASVISAHYEEESWVKYFTFGIAGLVGLARSYHGGHYSSDVVAGAMIGTLVGQSVVAHNKPQRGHKIMLLPETSAGVIGLRLVGDF